MLHAQSNYHHGAVIKAFREAAKMTQSRLAELWPKPGGVSVRYVQDIESGVKRITDQLILRKLSEILAIPLWQFGLSDYDPFHPVLLPGHGKSMYSETLDVAEDLIRQVWSLRAAARLTDAEMGVKRLNEIFAYFQKNLPPPVRLADRFQLLLVQVWRLNAVTALENKQYDQALSIYTDIVQATRNLNQPAMTAIALKSLGKELERKGEKQAAIDLLEEARDISLRASKLVITFVHSYLSRGYASIGDGLRFERSIDTGLNLASSLSGVSDNGDDFVYSWSPVSAILAEQSWGYLELNQPQKTLSMRSEIEREIISGQDTRLYAWIPLDWARANLMRGDVESSIADARDFYTRVTAMKSPHALSKAYSFVQELEEAGFADVPVVRDFKDELRAAKTDNQLVR